MGKIKNKALLVIALLIIMMGIFLSVLYPINAFFPASAKVTELEFDRTKVLDDLKSLSKADGSKFNINYYPYDPIGIKEPQIIHFLEYCYSFKINMQSNFGLYIYFYNPSGKEIDTSKIGKVLLANKYNIDGIPLDYEKFDIKLCNKSEESRYKNLFYKFRIIDKKGIDGKTILQRVNSNERRYDIAEIELWQKGNATTPKSHTVGGTFKFRGYFKGYGADAFAPSDFEIETTSLQTIKLKPVSTYYRSDVALTGTAVQETLNSVYFSINKDILSEFGKLQKIKAEWHEYKTKTALVTNDDTIYHSFKNHTGKKITAFNESVPSFYSNKRFVGIGGSGGTFYDWAYNLRPSGVAVSSDKISNQIPLIFKTNVSEMSKAFIESETIYNAMKNYNASFDAGKIFNDMSADLFQTEVDSGRVKGYNVVEFDADDNFDLMVYDKTTKWDKFFSAIFKTGKPNIAYSSLNPVYQIKNSDLQGSNISQELGVNPSDVNALKAYQSAQNILGNETFLFRYAQTDYWRTPAVMKIDSNETKNKAYACEQTVFLNFDILTLTFNKDGLYTVMPVSMSPMDVINGFNPPIFPKKFDWKRIIKIILMILVIIILIPLLPHIISFIITIIKLPFTIIGSISKAVKKNKSKKE